MELELIKLVNFGEVEASIYSDEDRLYMTIEQIASCLGYASRSGVEKIAQRNSHLKSPEFSVMRRLFASDGKRYETRVFTEEGILEIVMLSKRPNAKKFRAWLRSTMKEIRIAKLLKV